MLEVFEMLGFICFVIVAFIAIFVVIGIFIDLVKSLFKKKEEPRNPTPREKLELENDEYDWGHNVKNYMEE